MRMSLAVLAVAAGLATAAPAAAQYSDQQISDALLSTQWCTFRYNKTTGYSSSQRARFGRDGTLTVSRNSEGGSSGSGGSYYGQSQGGDVYRWAVQGGQLVLSNNEGSQALSLDEKRSSSGGFILIVDGTEWTPCS